MSKSAFLQTPQRTMPGQLPKGTGGTVSKNYLNTGKGWLKIKDLDRNEKCECGSEIKFKHCCLGK